MKKTPLFADTWFASSCKDPAPFWPASSPISSCLKDAPSNKSSYFCNSTVLLLCFQVQVLHGSVRFLILLSCAVSVKHQKTQYDSGKRRNSATLQPVAPSLPPIPHSHCVPQRTSSRKNSCQGGERYPALGANHLEVEDCGIPRSRSRTSRPHNHIKTKPSGKCTGHCHTRAVRGCATSVNCNRSTNMLARLQDPVLCASRTGLFTLKLVSRYNKMKQTQQPWNTDHEAQMEMEMDSHGGLKVTIRKTEWKIFFYPTTSWHRPLSARNEHQSHPLAEQAQACGRLIRRMDRGPDGTC